MVAGVEADTEELSLVVELLESFFWTAVVAVEEEERLPVLPRCERSPPSPLHEEVGRDASVLIEPGNGGGSGGGRGRVRKGGKRRARWRGTSEENIESRKTTKNLFLI